MTKVWESYTPTERQKQFHAVRPFNPKLIKGAIGGLGGGKTTCCEQEQAWVCQKTPDGKSVAMRATMNRAELSLIDDYIKILAGHARWFPSKNWFKFDNGHKLVITPADDWDRWGSLELCSFYIMEAQEVEYTVFDALNQRLRGKEGIIGGIPLWRGYFDARGVKKRHWIYERFVKKAWNIDMPADERDRDGRNPDFAYVQFRTYDNLEHLPAGYLEAQYRDHQGNIPWQKMMIEGEFGFDIEGRPVFECYDPDVHCAEIHADPTLPILRGWDFGYNHPAVVWAQYTRDGRFLVLQEFCPEGIARHDLVRETRAIEETEWPGRHQGLYRDFGDIAGEQENTTGLTDIEYVETALQTSIESRKARISDGLNVIRKLMTSTKRTKEGQTVPLFQVDPKCERLCEALGGAYYYEIDKKNDEERPIGKGYRDVVDALRYIAHLVVEEELGVPQRGYGGYGTGGESEPAGSYARY
jgi:hypothetical protein